MHGQLLTNQLTRSSSGGGLLLVGRGCLLGGGAEELLLGVGRRIAKQILSRGAHGWCFLVGVAGRLEAGRGRGVTSHSGSSDDATTGRACTTGRTR